MRRTLVLLAIVLLIGALIWLLRSEERKPAELVPASALGLMIVNRFPDSFDFLSETRLGEWLELDPAELENRVAAEWFVALKGSLSRAILILHSVEQKESGSFRPHITAFLRPKFNRALEVKDWIFSEAAERFGKDVARVEEEGSAQVIRGLEAGQVLYVAIEEGWLIVSNSDFGWRDVQLVSSDRLPRLRSKKSFTEIENHIGTHQDLFFYFGGEGVDGLLPEFGYGVTIEGEEVIDSYWAIEQSN